MSYTCRDCTNARNRELSRIRKEANPDLYRQKNKEYGATYRNKYPDRVAERHLRRRVEQPEACKASAQKYHASHPEVSRAQAQRRRARKRALPHSFTQTEWLQALAYFNNCCAVCERPQGLWHKLAQDHWIPLTAEQSDNPGYVLNNIIPLCDWIGGCNESKNNRDATEWLNARFGKRKAKQILSRIEAYFAWVREQDD